MRLPVVVAVVIASLGLFCGSSQAARMWLPKTDNPYCDVSTYTLRDVPEQAMSMLDSNGHPVIVVNTRTLLDQPAYGRFLMAHECCHHTLGHVDRYREGFGHVGPQPFFYIAPALKQMELDADCCAVRVLKFKHETDSIEAAEEAMIGFGDTPTGAYYPTGDERADNIAKCAAAD
jgi:hypothetical protein